METSCIVAMILLAAFGGYVLTSLLLLKYPTLIHEKKRLKFRCRHISHRGGAGENLENTMTAFRHAVNLGTDMLELDCHITKDGQIVVSHDNNLRRATGLNVNVSDCLKSELPLLKSELPIDFCSDKTFKTHCDDRDIPLLEDVFKEFPNIPINVDIKIDNDELIHKVSELVKKYGREDLTVWGNRSDIIVTKCHKENPNIPILFSLKRVVWLLVFYYTGLLPFIPLKESFYEIVMPSLVLKNNFNISKRMKVIAHVTDFLLMSRGMFDHLDKRGIQVYLWVLNDEDQFEKAFRLGATGVMTDYPTKLKEFLTDEE